MTNGLLFLRRGLSLLLQYPHLQPLQPPATVDLHQNYLMGYLLQNKSDCMTSKCRQLQNFVKIGNNLIF